MRAPRILIYVNPKNRVSPRHTAAYFQNLVQARLPGVDLRIARDAQEARHAIEDAEILYGWGFDAELFAAAKHLRWIEKTGAGVEDIIACAGAIGRDVQITRIDGRILAPRMAEYALAAIFGSTTGMFDAIEAKRQRKWLRYELESAAGRTVGIAGVGDIGIHVGQRLAANGFLVIGWRRTQGSDVDGFARIFAGADEFHSFLAVSEILILLLPLTAATRHLFNAESLAQLPAGSLIVNLGRGGLIDDTALLDALNRGHVGRAVLDVFAVEPLPDEHPYWTAPRVVITPHVAGPMVPEEVVDHFCDNYRRFLAGETLHNRVDLGRGY